MTLILVDREGKTAEIVDHLIDKNQAANSPQLMFGKLDIILSLDEFFPEAKEP